jgi:hypothetical protein
MIERVPIRSARQDNRIFGFIESNKAFDLLGRPCADYDPNTGLLCDLRDGSVVGYVTLNGKFLGSSQVAQKLFPEAYEVTSEESPRSYVNNIAGVLDAAEQQPVGADAGFDDPEVTSGPRVIAVKSTQVSVADRLPDLVEKVVREPFAQEQQSTEHSEMAVIGPETPAAPRIIAIETTIETPSNANGGFVRGEEAGKGRSLYGDCEPSGIFQAEVATSSSNIVYLHQSFSPSPKVEPRIPPLTIPTKHTEQSLPLPDSEEELISVAAPPHVSRETWSVDYRDEVSQESEGPSCLPTAQHLESENDSGGGNGQAQSDSLIEHEGSAPRASENSDADKAIKNKCQTGDARVLETVAAFMHRVAEYVGSADNDQRESSSPFLDESGKLEAELSGDVEASPTAKQDERTDEAVFEDGDGVLKAPDSHNQPGALAFNVERLCEDDRVSVEPAPKNTETIDSEDEGVEVRSDNSYDTMAVASFEDAKLGGPRTDINYFDEKAQGKADCTLSSDSDAVAVQLSSVSQAESHGAVAMNEKIDLEKKYDTVRGTSPESPLERDEKAQARSDPIDSDHKPFDVHTVAEGLEGAFEFLRDMRSVSWLDSGHRDFSSSEENVLEELERLLKQLEK